MYNSIRLKGIRHRILLIWQWNLCEGYDGSLFLRRCDSRKFLFYTSVSFLSQLTKPIVITFVIDYIVAEPLLCSCSNRTIVVALFNYLSPVYKPDLMSDSVHSCSSLTKKPISFLSFLKFCMNRIKIQGGEFDVYGAYLSLIRNVRCQAHNKQRLNHRNCCQAASVIIEDLNLQAFLIVFILLYFYFIYIYIFVIYQKRTPNYRI